jgi:hypothetical protein
MPKEAPADRAGLAESRDETMDMFGDMAPEEAENLLRWGVLEPDREFKAPSGAFIQGIEVGGQVYKPFQVDPRSGTPLGR